MSKEEPRVLIVDDEYRHLRMAEIMLVNTGSTIVTAQGVMEAFELLRDWTPHIVITDVRMPGASGMDLIAKMRSVGRLARIPVILMSSHVTPETLELAEIHGAASVLEKPLDLAKFQALVGQVLKRTQSGVFVAA